MRGVDFAGKPGHTIRPSPEQPTHDHEAVLQLRVGMGRGNFNRGGRSEQLDTVVWCRQAGV
jgi:hypothetical protein